MWLKDGNLISVLIKLYLFWRVTETALCHYADLGRGERSDTRGYGENESRQQMGMDLRHVEHKKQERGEGVRDLLGCLKSLGTVHVSCNLPYEPE